MVGRPTIRAVNKIGDIEVKVSVAVSKHFLIYFLFFLPSDLLLSLIEHKKKLENLQDLHVDVSQGSGSLSIFVFWSALETFS